MDQERHPHGQVLTEVLGDHVLHIEVDRVEKRNAFTPKITAELVEAYTRLDEDDELWVGVLTFAGPHSTAGLELPLFFTDEGFGVQAAKGVDPFGVGRRLTKPLVSAVQGMTLTAGIEIAVAGDIIVAAEDASFCQLEPRRGIPAVGGSTLRYAQRSGWGNAMYHLLRADTFDAAEAYRIGLVQEVVPVGTQVQRAIELGLEIAECAPLPLRAMLANARLTFEQGDGVAAKNVQGMMDHVMGSEDLKEGVASFVERRTANFKGR